MSAAPIQFYNRLTRRIETEFVYGEAPLRFVYENPAGRLALRALVRRRLFSRWYGARMDSPASRARIAPFIEKFGVDAGEFAGPVESFATFNEFFSRRLKPGARPLAGGDQTLVFPADGRHLVIPDLSLETNFWVKGLRFDLRALLQDDAAARRYEGGAMLISRLCPVDYHRFHFPCAGIPGASRLINGPLYSVSPIALARRPSILWENKRVVTQLDDTPAGAVLLLEVGATCVGSIVQTCAPGVRAAKGDEKGYFRFGGSCFITIFEPGRARFAADLMQHSAAGREVYARMGDAAAEALTA
ncbi:MAG TPA: phosphatidylserine decarboxylase [Verrucomicrobiales bacterium]|nr:phosphatidylserine decarboxylase [Verrucomicrobiales bacterium]